MRALSFGQLVVGPRRSSPHGYRFIAAGNGNGEKDPPRGRHQGKFFLPGEPIRETGIYEVLHDRNHRVAHEAVLHANDLFPECESCQNKVRFRLVRTAPYIFDDEDFAPE